ncbi:BTAD domain-containing putative transcriptional regulator [Actinomadura miaoliensis]|uniref:Bacterial transcriptional activator domain-containing protein n=1 Tax=Actinomadura miaoliensis TaxID=430685 RepID=A0ABP7VCX6_9ACTN
MTVRRTGNLPGDPPSGGEPGLGRARRLGQATRTPVRVRARRGPRDVLAGLGAIAALAVLLVGVPYALLAVFGSPIPDRLPSAGDLTGRMGESALITVLVALVWLAWLQFALCVVVEVYAGVRGIGVPARVPLAGGTQSLVHRLVATALLLFTATTAIMPAFSGRELHQQRPAQVQTQEFRPVAAVAAEPRAAAAAEHAAPEEAGGPERSARTTKIYRVQPPEGRHHESLWEIADKCLGDGRRYKEIYALNKGRTQPDGSRLTIASLIRPGWILEMPEDAKGAKVIPVEELDDYFRHGHAVPDKPKEKPRPAPEQGAPAKPTPQKSAPQTPAPHAPAPQTPAPHTPAPQTPAPQAPAPAPSVSKPAQPPATPTPRPSQTKAPETPPASSTPAPQPSSEMGGGADTGGAGVPGHRDGAVLPFDLDWPHGLAAASLLAAGLLGALGRRRRAQMWHRAFGHMIKRPVGAAAQAEQALRIGADENAARLLDLGLRHLSRSMAAEGRALPTVYGVHLGPTSLDLWIAPADRNPPAPWQAYDEGQVWRLRADALPTLEASDLGDVLAPYPGLVSIGTNPTGRILVDLEAAHGLIALNGPPDARRSALAAIALELATNRWSDHMRITLVGFGRDLGEGLAGIAPDRIRVVDTLDEALPELEGRSEEVRQALAASGVDSVLTGRCRGVFGEAWMPHYLIMAEQPTEREADRLVALARTGTRMAAGYLVAGEVQGATWTWELDAAGRLHAGVLGFEVDAQLVPEDHYRAVVDLFHTAARLESVPLPDVADDMRLLAGPDHAGSPEPPGTGQFAVDIRLLGPIEIDAPGPIDDSRRELCTEILLYLATHPGGVHPTVLGGAIWPRGVSAGVRDASIARVSDWLGRDARGRPNLYYDERGRIRLGSEVRVDWAVFRWLVWRSAAEPESETAYMSYALDLVRGPVLADRPRGRYAWLAADDLEYEVTARVIDVAHRLVVLRLDEGDARGAVGAARAGLRLAYDDEGLWRDLLRATHATGDEGQVHVVIDEMRSRLLDRTAYDELQPETEALIEELLPYAQRLQAS